MSRLTHATNLTCHLHLPAIYWLLASQLFQIFNSSLVVGFLCRNNLTKVTWMHCRISIDPDRPQRTTITKELIIVHHKSETRACHQQIRPKAGGKVAVRLDRKWIRKESKMQATTTLWNKVRKVVKGRRLRVTFLLIGIEAEWMICSGKCKTWKRMRSRTSIACSRIRWNSWLRHSCRSYRHLLRVTVVIYNSSVWIITRNK